MTGKTWGRLPLITGATILLLTVGVGTPVIADETDGAIETVEFHDAVLRWGMTNEANNKAHAPGTWNFFSAGKIPNPGKGGTTLKSDAWDQESGDVSIEKRSGDGYTDATWDGLSTDADGKTIESATSGRYSDHQFVFSNGKGVASPDGSKAQITWDGDVSVIFYSGMSFFYVSDPVLDVADGKGTLSGTLSGYRSSQADQSVWEEVDPCTVTLADLPSVALSEGTVEATPAFDDVKVSTKDFGDVTGSFPQSFISYHDKLGTAAFWHKSGSSTDKAKKALPLTIKRGDETPSTTPVPNPTVPTCGDQPEPTPTPTPTPSATPSATPSPSATPTSTTCATAKLTRAEFRWGMSNEANNKAHDGSSNVFSAGKASLKGGTKLTSSKWKQKSGNVAIEKWDGSNYKAATWNGLSTDSNGNTIRNPQSGVYSNHQFVFSRGIGTADLAKGTATIAWDGDVTVTFYLGLSVFFLSDPVLKVANGKGTITAVLSGIAGSRNDPTAGGDTVAAKRVTVAVLPKVALRCAGFSVDPAYDKVKVDTDEHGSVTGSFPESFIKYQEKLGTAAFWYNSNSNTDDAKKALPVTVSLDASNPVDADEPDDSESDSDDVSNDALSLPTALNQALAAVPGAVAGAGRAVAEAAAFPVRLVSSTLGTGAPTLWIVGSVLWVLTAAAVTETLRRFPTPTHRSFHDDLS